MKLHEKLVKLRKEKGWNQADLGKQANINISYLSRLEQGKSQPSAPMLKKLAEVLGVSTDYLLDDTIDDFTPVSIEDKPLAQRIKLLNSLDPKDQETVINVIDALLTKKKVKDLVTKGYEFIEEVGT